MALVLVFFMNTWLFYKQKLYQKTALLRQFIFEKFMPTQHLNFDKKWLHYGRTNLNIIKRGIEIDQTFP